METVFQRPYKTSRIPRLLRAPVEQSASSVPTQDPFVCSIIRKPLPYATEQEVPANRGLPEDVGVTSLGESKGNRVVETSRAGNEDIGSLSKTLPARRRPRPSLSDRTTETLAQIPLSASPKRRRSSFFQNNDLVSSPIRPATSMARARPSTSMGLRPPLPDFTTSSRRSSPTKQRLAPTTGNRLSPRTPVKVDNGRFVPRSLPPARPALEETIRLTPSKEKTSLTGFRSNNHMPPAGLGFMR